ncbi:putative G-protein coupled receptor No18 [Holothuria leucospilota]|uniref:G-protein coupled receptor No18 n=1 Tax=Holothuria leucospilota TaxID=206669 RepID=A0A9Q1C6M0_HOLLE|nr:putative G-protein coupled receptor No18 [Holothuria leucospilota]
MFFQRPEAGTWPLGESGCIIWIISGTCFIYSSLCTVVVISYDRFLLVKDAITYTVTTTRGRVFKMIFAIWAIAVTYSIITNFVKYFGFRKIENETALALPIESVIPFNNDTFVANFSLDKSLLFSPTVCTEDVYSSVTSYTAFIVFDFLVFFCVLAATNACVCLKLQQRAREGIFQATDGLMKYRVTQEKIIAVDTSVNNNVTLPESVSKEETDKSEVMAESSAIRTDATKNEINVTKAAQIKDTDKENMYPTQLLQLQKSRKAVLSLTILVAAFVVCWCPYYFIAILYHSGLVEFPEAVIDAALDLIWVNSSINPILYALTNVRFKKGMTSVLRKYLCWRK